MNPTTAGCGSILESGLMARLRPAHCGDRLVHSGELEAPIAHVVAHPDLSRLSDLKIDPLERFTEARFAAKTGSIETTLH